MTPGSPLRRMLVASVIATGACLLAADLPDRLMAGAAMAAARPPVAGDWQGELNAGGRVLRVVLHVIQNDDGTWRGTIDSPDQAAIGIRLDRLTVSPDSLGFAHDGSDMAFSGRFNETGQDIVGAFKQAGTSFPLTLKKTAKAVIVRKPQEPQPPFPYVSQDITYTNPKAGIVLAGTLTTPSAGGPFPALILINGSGSQDRDCNLFGHKPFLLMADSLTRRGFAVLRVDDRGIGGSGGDAGTVTTPDSATDVAAGLAYLQSRPDIDRARIGLVGHSEGSLIGSMVAASTKAIAAFVMIGGPGLPGETILLKQGDVLNRMAGASSAEAEASHKLQQSLFAIVKSEADPEIAQAKLSAVLHVLMAKEGRSEDAKAGAAVEAQVRALSSPWYRYFLGYDPRPELAKVTCPVLALNGEKDLQVNAKDNLESISQTLKKAGNADVTVQTLPGLNHLLQTAGTGMPSEYGTLTETMAPAALESIGQWLTTRLGKTP
ncbi:MAG: alpha/beta hydrolase [Candidatus Sericytochromatia bacterium]|nr:alpha/beta hydrolase [Candidatus Sericytochromatia bacterium]